MLAFFQTILYKPLYNLFLVIVSVMPDHNLGLAIIVLTVLVRLLLTPLKYKSFESQAKQKELQPELKRIQEKYKDDRQAQSMAMMQMYKDKGINPLSGCLPLLVQFPILIVLYYVFRSGLGPEQAQFVYSFVNAPDTISKSFLWIKDVTLPDPTFIFPILAGVAQFFYSKSVMPAMQTSNDPNDMAAVMSKQMLYLFPIMTIIIARTLPAGLSLYWVTATVVDWYQQHHGMKKVSKKLETGKVTVSVRQKGKE